MRWVASTWTKAAVNNLNQQEQEQEQEQQQEVNLNPNTLKDQM
jgi:hypothetical protein